MKRIFLGLLIIATLITVLSSCSLFSAIMPDPSCDEHNFVDWVCTECGENYYVYVGELSFTSNGDGTCSVKSNGTGIEHITIPSVSPDGDTVTSIANSAFYRNYSIKQIIIPNTVTSIGDEAFYGCNSLANITIPDSVTSIGDDAFYCCDSLANITIPDSITSVGSGAFFGCTSLKYNEYGNAYYLKSESNPYQILVKAKATTTTKIDIHNDTKVIANSVFKGWSSLTSITIPGSVTSIGDYAFSGCTSLANINIPDSVTEIGSHAFMGCTSLTSITIPDSITEIDDYVFYSCTSIREVHYTGDIADWCGIDFLSFSSNPLLYGGKLYINNELVTSIAIPDSVTSIGDYAFYNYTSLTSITIPKSVTEIGSCAFEDCNSITEVHYTGDIADWCGIDFLSNFSNPLLYGEKLYINNELVTSITIPDSVTEIGNFAFIGCTSLTSITIPDSVTEIGGYAFNGCTSLTSIIIPDSVTKIYDATFENCGSLESVALPKSVTNIDRWAFCGCTSLTSIVIPASVTYIGEEALAVEYINFGGSKAQWENITADREWYCGEGECTVYCSDGWLKDN